MASVLGLAMMLGSVGARANDWVYGSVKWVEDYGSYCCAADGHQYQVMVYLINKTWANAADAAICTERFRVVTGLQGVTEEIKKRHFVMLLTARMTGSSVRLFYSTDGAPNCQVQIVSVGDLS